MSAPHQSPDVVIPGTLVDALSTLIQFFKPVAAFIREIAGNGWLGFAIIFALFFAIFLLRAGGLRKENQGYANGLRYIGARGSGVVAAYLLLLLADYLLTPVAWFVVSGLWNSLFAEDVGFFTMIGLLFTDSEWRGQFADFWNSDRLILPLGFRSAFLLLVAFATMFTVGNALARPDKS